MKLSLAMDFLIGREMDCEHSGAFGTESLVFQSVIIGSQSEPQSTVLQLLNRDRGRQENGQDHHVSSRASACFEGQD